MAANSTDRVALTTHWVFKEDYDLDIITTKRDVMLNHIKAIIEVAAADGVLDEKERQWIIGYAYATGKLFLF